MNPRDRRNLVCGALVVLAVLVAASAQAAPLGAIAEERLEPSQLVLQPLFEFERAALTVVGPAGYVVEQTFGPGEAVGLALSDSEGRGLPDGRYRYSLRLTPGPASSSDVQNGLFFVHEGSGVSRTEQRDQLASIRETLNQERESHLQAYEQAAPISRVDEGVTVSPPFSDARLWCGRRRCCGCEGDLTLGGSILKDGYPFLHNYGGYKYYNTALGLDALASVNPREVCGWSCGLYGAWNTAVGQNALRETVSGSGNTAIGYGALRHSTRNIHCADALCPASNNTASGAWALYYNIFGSENTATGHGALRANIHGYENTATGWGALRSNTYGNNNTAIGVEALADNLDGFRNVAVGWRAGHEVTTGDDNIFLGSGAEAGDANTIRIGGSTGIGWGAQNRTFIAGIRGITTEYADSLTVVIDSAGQLGTVSSSRRAKEEIRDMGEASGGVLELRPVTFRYRREPATGEKPLRYGLIAEEVAERFPELVAFDEEGEPEAVLYRLLTPMLLNELQKQARLNQEQQLEIERLRSVERELAAIKSRLADLEATEEPTLRVAAGRHPPPESGSR